MNIWLKKMFERRNAAIRDNVCASCCEPILSFKDEVAEKEYRITGWCQFCQDKYFEQDPFVEEEE